MSAEFFWLFVVGLLCVQARRLKRTLSSTTSIPTRPEQCSGGASDALWKNESSLAALKPRVLCSVANNRSFRCSGTSSEYTPPKISRQTVRSRSLSLPLPPSPPFRSSAVAQCVTPAFAMWDTMYHYQGLVFALFTTCCPT